MMDTENTHEKYQRRFEALEARIVAMGERVDRLMNRVDAVKTAKGAPLSTINELHGRMDALEALDPLEALEALTARVRVCEDQLPRLDAHLEAIGGHGARLDALEGSRALGHSDRLEERVRDLEDQFRQRTAHGDEYREIVEAQKRVLDMDSAGSRRLDQLSDTSESLLARITALEHKVHVKAVVGKYDTEWELGYQPPKDIGSVDEYPKPHDGVRLHEEPRTWWNVTDTWKDDGRQWWRLKAIHRDDVRTVSHKPGEPWPFAGRAPRPTYY